MSVIDSPRLIRKNKIKPELSCESITAWNENERTVLNELPFLEDTEILSEIVAFIPNNNIESCDINKTKSEPSGTFTDVEHGGSCKRRKKNDGWLKYMGKLPWILLTNSLIQVSII